MEHIKINSIKITSEQKKLIILGICALIGLAVCFLPTTFNNKSQKKQENQLSDFEYVSSVEERLSETISSIKGAGNARVFITIESSYETVYLSNAKLDETIDDFDKSSTTSEKVLATMKSGTYSEEPVVVKKICPKISGVLIVCKGGEDNNVKNEIIKAASTALNISSSRIYVTGGKEST